MLAVHWTGRAELDRTRVEVDAVNGSWYEPRKHLATWTVERGGPRVTWVRVPRALTAAGSNTLELSVPPLPAETRPTGWRGVLDAIAPGVLDDPGAGDSGALEMDFAQVSAVRPDGSWAETRGLAEAYAARKMWVEVGDLYRKAVSEGQAPGSPEDLAVFLAAAQAAGDAGLKAQLDSQLAALIPHKVDVVLGRLDEPGGVRLLGYDIRRGRPGQARVTLYFEALRPLPADYTAWVHATPADPAVLFGQAQQAGHFTLDHRLETSTWTPGGIYRASYDAPLPPGDYDFSLGLWRWEDGSRLYRADNPAEHAVDLGRVSLD